MNKRMGHWWNDTDKGKQHILRETCPTTTVLRAHLTWTGQELNPGLHSESSN